jgi:large subunit ribosomal protein L21
VTRLAQIAAWSAADVEKHDEALNARGRIARDDWVGQAKALSKG